MLLSLVYFALRCLLQTLAPSGRSNFEREVEVLVLRHQLKVLSRGSRRPVGVRNWDHAFDLRISQRETETSQRLFGCP
jgi:hypothetical protein